MFSDVTDHWAKGCILALAKRGVVSGYRNNTFRPLAVVSRAEFAALMRQAFPELPMKRSARLFPDVLPQYWASLVIAWASERGLFSGDRSGRFLPRQTISRVQTVVVLMAALSAEQASEAMSPSEIEQAAQQTKRLIGQTFTDAAAIPSYGQEAVGLAIAANLFESLPEPRAFLPNQAMTRGEVAALLCQALAIPSTEISEASPILTPELARDRQGLFQQFIQKEAEFNAEKLAFLDRGAQSSPIRRHLSQASAYLQKARSKAGQAAAISSPLNNTSAYPSRGDRPAIDGTGLDFLAPEILSACVCLSTAQAGELKSRWLGREAFVNRQMWSSTKFLPLLNIIDRANGIAPSVPIGDCTVRRAGAQSGFPFLLLASGIMSYDNRVATSNSLAAMFKRFNTPAALEKWTRQLTGNQSLDFQGRYGEIPFIEFPELWSAKDQKVLIKSPQQAHSGQNLVSTYDLTRLITMVGGHWRLPRRAIVPNAQGHSLSSLIQAMGVDTARYIEVAFETLALTQVVRSPVIISKSGFGRSDQRDRTELTYCALAEFDLPRPGSCDPTASHQRYSIGMTLIAAQQTGDGNQEARFVDALMATEVTEIIRRLILGKL
ncbi:S-layer homology domain-containing protein [cf. Phormidesmis sp. LEGE 11477]|uniref:S-layer homology domain-containing protein n=1 Tax=cf. Phormidesmis sp. LEGE 11477 TaxID=1828680 RepID=UPI00187F558B|nr:S-layer homology domain-containing protein [cf. Phormidesmis sp. LEGE 11477]MBE9062789.1 S-layer homology domain-containing protein [cf. Phormidesmis sp. LEGE 11477]